MNCFYNFTNITLRLSLTSVYTYRKKSYVIKHVQFFYIKRKYQLRIAMLKRSPGYKLGKLVSKSSAKFFMVFIMMLLNSQVPIAMRQIIIFLSSQWLLPKLILWHDCIITNSTYNENLFCLQQRVRAFQHLLFPFFI